MIEPPRPVPEIKVNPVREGMWHVEVPDADGGPSLLARASGNQDCGKCRWR